MFCRTPLHQPWFVPGQKNPTRLDVNMATSCKTIGKSMVWSWRASRGSFIIWCFFPWGKWNSITWFPGIELFLVWSCFWGLEWKFNFSKALIQSRIGSSMIFWDSVICAQELRARKTCFFHNTVFHTRGWAVLRPVLSECTGIVTTVTTGSDWAYSTCTYQNLRSMGMFFGAAESTIASVPLPNTNPWKMLLEEGTSWNMWCSFCVLQALLELRKTLSSEMARIAQKFPEQTMLNVQWE